MAIIRDPYKDYERHLYEQRAYEQMRGLQNSYSGNLGIVHEPKKTKPKPKTKLLLLEE